MALAEARELALHMRRALQRGEDPRSVLCRTPCGPTFRAVAEALIASKAHEWRHAKHRAQWRSTLEAYAFPVLGRLPVAEITVEHVLAVLKPIWTRRPETASRLRGRLEAVLDFAQARGWREGANPARWGEIDMEKRVWTIPAERTKAGREHRVPLSPRALALLAELPRVEGMDLIFPGSGSAMSDMTLSAVIRRPAEAGKRSKNGQNQAEPSLPPSPASATPPLPHRLPRPPGLAAGSRAIEANPALHPHPDTDERPVASGLEVRVKAKFGRLGPVLQRQTVPIWGHGASLARRPVKRPMFCRSWRRMLCSLPKVGVSSATGSTSFACWSPRVSTASTTPASSNRTTTTC